MKGFGIYVKNDLLDDKHREGMGESIWLYLWLLDKMTSITEQGQGVILGGKPVKYTYLLQDFKNLKQRTYRRYLKNLVDSGYIITTRTSVGLIIRVNKAEKRFNKKSDVQKMAHQVTKPKKEAERASRDVPKIAHQDVKKVKSDVPKVAKVMGQKWHEQIKTPQRDTTTSTNKLVEAQSAFGNSRINKILETFKKVMELDSLGGSEKANRRFAYLLMNKLGKAYPEQDPDKLVAGLINLARRDEFWHPNITSLKDLFYKAEKIIQRYKSSKSNRGGSIIKI